MTPEIPKSVSDASVNIKIGIDHEVLSIDELAERIESFFKVKTEINKALVIAENQPGNLEAGQMGRYQNLQKVVQTQLRLGLIEDAKRIGEEEGISFDSFGSADPVTDGERTTTSKTSSITLEFIKAMIREGRINEVGDDIPKVTPDRRSSVILEMANAQAHAGNIDDALETITNSDSINPSDKSRGIAAIAEIQANTGKDAEPLYGLALKEARSIRDDSDQSLVRTVIADSLARVGFIQSAVEVLNEVRYLPHRVTVYTSVGRALGKQGIKDSDRAFELALTTAKQVLDPEERFPLLEEIAVAQASIGKLDEARNTVQQINSINRRDQLLKRIEEGNFEAEPKENTELFPPEYFNEDLNSEVVEHLRNAISIAISNPFSDEAVRQITQDIAMSLLQNRSSHIFHIALGYLGVIDPKHLTDEESSLITQTGKIDLLSGAAARTKDLEYIKLARETALDESGETKQEQKVKMLVDNIVEFLSYEDASNTLFSLLGTVGKDDVFKKGETMTVRILKGLIDIENPRGRTVATRLFTDKRLDRRYREYLARKLIQQDYWDNRLEHYLAFDEEEGDKNFVEDDEDRELQPKATQLEILGLLIDKFGLTPDLPSYQMLEKPGVLKAPTLEGRIQELQDAVSSFEGKTRDELIDYILKSPDRLKVFYMIKAGEYRYSVVNDYSQNKFSQIINKIRELDISEQVLERFRLTLEKNGYQPSDAESIVNQLREGGAPISPSESRVVRFSADVEYGSDRERAMARLQDVWKNELKSLLISKKRGLTPETITETLTVLEESTNITDIDPKLGASLKLDVEKIDVETISLIARDFRNRLRDTYRSQKNRDALSMLDDKRDDQIITEYLAKYLPQSDATSEWQSHLQEVLSAIQNNQTQAGSKNTRREFELTFLDKNKDFIRAIRFADAAQCCFNASNENFDARTFEWPTRLNKDPLSFIIDLREVGAQTIEGFIFGRMGINPRTGHPVIMLNGIYSQHKGDTLNDNMLRIIEEKMAPFLKADQIVIASKFGGMINPPTGYETVDEMRIEAIRALQDEDGNPENNVYDDIGEEANAPFMFQGYSKSL